MQGPSRTTAAEIWKHRKVAIAGLGWNALVSGPTQAKARLRLRLADACVEVQQGPNLNSYPGAHVSMTMTTRFMALTMTPWPASATCRMAL